MSEGPGLGRGPKNQTVLYIPLYISSDRNNQKRETSRTIDYPTIRNMNFSLQLTLCALIAFFGSKVNAQYGGCMVGVCYLSSEEALRAGCTSFGSSEDCETMGYCMGC
ncbi:hypothetical protein LENED_003056 [Lentinula edodes]|uniref:Uncharacterized protein n=1 Tax=Lentinula edodes TaxID=5353 RepID=A0A1Q3E2H3_LENED|nr:hypothetical protein LENED_003056 [Lentinula edodes]